MWQLSSYGFDWYVLPMSFLIWKFAHRSFKWSKHLHSDWFLCGSSYDCELRLFHTLCTCIVNSHWAAWLQFLPSSSCTFYLVLANLGVDLSVPQSNLSVGALQQLLEKNQDFPDQHLSLQSKGNQLWPPDFATLLPSYISKDEYAYFFSVSCQRMDLRLQESPCVPPPGCHLHRPGWHQQILCLPGIFWKQTKHCPWSRSTVYTTVLTFFVKWYSEQLPVINWFVIEKY